MLILALFSFACTTSVQSSSSPTSDGKADDDADSADSGGSFVVEQDDGDAGAEGDGGDSSGATSQGPDLPKGASCSTHADCGEGGICEGVGCGEGEGRCVEDPAGRMCTRDLVAYCGCDGKEFKTSGSCPGDRFEYRGPCEPKLADGEPCQDSRQCASGQCLGEGLEGCAPMSQGTCGTADCTADLAPYCSCNGNDFQSSGSCPGRQYAYRGPCEAAE
ncbi:hypothetical protein PPSIR1_40360 [Plesiocystis pacifica SIR-1]|uniref:Lipoprotein n=1 Tax=Plesiocystis pacifica SIR-1 TaxID=391625 RepID=A6FYK2_9BACT|nr:hypothetical protein PPSIR1_40360 [Plesiocystis pacifica SIR-1]